MTVTTQVDEEEPTVETLYFAYDASGNPMSVTYNDVTYYYVTNLQGDVLAILDNTGTSVVEYTYDAWGNILTSAGLLKDTLGEANPLRYRGYFYDNDTQLYYLQSRYYDPELGRFINADAFVSTGQGLLGNNMFAYCLNNPVFRTDIDGKVSVTCHRDDSNLFDRMLEGASRGGSGRAVSGAIVGAAGLFSVWMLGETIAAPNKPMTSSGVDEKEEARAIAISTSSNSEAVYYGIDLYGGYWKYTTAPMSFQEADAWATLTAASNTYSPRASWGLYTQNQADALAMAIWLGYYDGPVRLDPAKSSKYLPHFHVSDKTIHGIPAPNFHIWFGGQ